MTINALELKPIKLSQDIDKSFVFKTRIDPILSYKRDGEKIFYDDSFYFHSIKNYSNIFYD